MLDIVEIYKDDAGEWRWRRKAPNHEVISQGEGYTDRFNALTGALRANPDVNTSDVKIIGRLHDE